MLIKSIPGQSLQELGGHTDWIFQNENPAEPKQEACKKLAGNHPWIGNNKHKGSGIFAAGNIEIKSIDWSNEYQDNLKANQVVQQKIALVT